MNTDALLVGISLGAALVFLGARLWRSVRVLREEGGSSTCAKNCSCAKSPLPEKTELGMM
jgi:hypothetical protein